MKYYNLLFIGLMRLGHRTEYKEVSEYLASWGMALIIELNLIVILGMIGVGKILLKAYVLIPLYVILIIANVQYYKRNINRLHELENAYSKSNDVNLNFPDGLALFFIAESAILPLIYAFTKN